MALLNKSTDEYLEANLVTHKYTIENHEIKTGDGNSRTNMKLSPGFPVQRRTNKWNATMEMVAKKLQGSDFKYQYQFELGATSKDRKDIAKAIYQIKVYTQRRDGTMQYVIANFKGDAKVADDGLFSVKEILDPVKLLQQVENKWANPDLCVEFEITEIKKKRGNAESGGNSAAKKGRLSRVPSHSTSSMATRSKPNFK